MSFTIKNLFSFPIIFLIKVYQWTISPFFPGTCRHIPSCSQYMIESIKEYGVFKGIGLGLKRISKCHPWGTYGFDPVSKREGMSK